MKNNNKVLITGGAGFIGSHLAEELLRSQFHVTIIDNLSTGRIDNLKNFKDHPQLKVIIDTVNNQRLLEEEIANTGFIFHLASSVGVRLIMDKTVQSIQNIFQTSQTILETASKHQKPLLIFSTSEVYGKSQDYPFKEENDCVLGEPSKLRWSYACAKHLTEFLSLAYFREQQLPVRIVRLFNTVGPRQVADYGMVVPTFINQALNNQPLTVYGDGKQKRCFCSVYDIVKGLKRIMESPHTAGEVINLGSNQEISIIELAKLVITLTKSKSTIEFIDAKKVFGENFEDIELRYPSLEKAQKLINWQPQFSINNIINDIRASLEKTH